MAITIKCHCGQQFTAADDLGGKRVICPQCERKITAPQAKVKAQDGQPSKLSVTCECGKGLSVSSALAGQAVKCPSCGQSVTVPKSTASPTTIAVRCHCKRTLRVKSELAGTRITCPSCQTRIEVPVPREDSDSEDATSNLVDLLDEIGAERSSTGRRCPKCKNDMAREAVLCIECGYNLKTRKFLGDAQGDSDGRGKAAKSPWMEWLRFLTSDRS